MSRRSVHMQFLVLSDKDGVRETALLNGESWEYASETTLSMLQSFATSNRLMLSIGESMPAQPNVSCSSMADVRAWITSTAGGT